MEFARNPVSADTFDEALSPETVQQHTGSLWLLVDVALLPSGAASGLSARLRLPLRNALQGSSLASFGEHAPHLLALPHQTQHRREVLERFVALDSCAPAFSIIASAADESELIELCGHLALATIDGDLRVHCRFADTRVLPNLLGCLLPIQAARIARCVHQWRWLDHMAARQLWQPSQVNGESAAAPSDQTGLALSPLQFSTMLRASEPDTLFQLLWDNTPELVPKSERGAFRNQLQRILHRADTFKLITPNDRLQFAILSLSCGEDFHDRAALKPTWQAVAANSTLEAEMKSWTDAIWDAIQPAQVHD